MRLDLPAPVQVERGKRYELGIDADGAAFVREVPDTGQLGPGEIVATTDGEATYIYLEATEQAAREVLGPPEAPWGASTSRREVG